MATIRSKEMKGLSGEGADICTWLRRCNDLPGVGILQFDRDMRIVWAEVDQGGFHGRLPEKPEGLTCHEFFPGSSLSCQGCPCMEAIETGKAVHVVQRQPDAASTEDPCWDVYGVPVRGVSGKIEGGIQIARCLDDRMAIQVDLERSGEKSWEFLRTIREPVVMIDPDFRIVWANDATVPLFGGDVMGQQCFKVLMREDSSCKECVVKAAFSEQGLHRSDVYLTLSSGVKEVFTAAAGIVEWHGDGSPKIGAVVFEPVRDTVLGDGRTAVHLEEMRSLTCQLIYAEERERRRFAADLHDSVAQTLAISGLRLQMLQRRLKDSELVQEMRYIIEDLDSAAEAVESLVFELSPSVLYRLGLVPALESLAEKMGRVYHLTIVVEDDLRPKPLREEVRILLFRSVRELLLNVVRHAQAQRVRVCSERRGDCLCLRVIDDGIGFEMTKGLPLTQWTAGFGLSNIEARLDRFGGHMEIDSVPGQGTEVVLVSPLQDPCSSRWPGEHENPCR
jgi:signal transduction histidine kinase